jgi:hypothetical protein
MSANNWTGCPACIKKEEDEKERVGKEIYESYGKIPQKEFLKKMKELEAGNDEEGRATLREDWELGTDGGGEFFVSYRCSCGECGFSFSFKHKEQLDLTVNKK